MDIRVGNGIDVHRLVSGRKLILGGVEISHKMGLEGHSDADVLLHAVIDALLGAAKLGDIGVLFPPSDASYKDADSLKLLGRVMALVKAKGFCVGNVDCVIIAQEPKLRPYIALMEENLAETLGIEPDRVSVKATTEEGLGYTGRRAGIRAHAVCLVYGRTEP
ncbi:MAG: 2-C-methyl-D-erythritol 2,4-cyclodiphosphate synthase [Clostridiales bacterium]|nr:2-C-methyl-D-erythritol 2,4-cyclodiphosphate synthase [Clostridiales bacterium]